MKASNDDKTAVRQHHLKDGDNQKFRFEVVGQYDMPVTSPPQIAPPIPRANSLDETLPDVTTPLLAAEALLPYFTINDALPRDQAVHQTPYYKLKKEQYWSKIYQKVLEGAAQTYTYNSMFKFLIKLKANTWHEK